MTASCPFGASRRSLLGTLAVTAAAALSVSAAAQPPSEAQPKPPSNAPSYPFEGVHQAGITTPAQAVSTFASFTVTATSRAELQALFQMLTQRIRFLTKGGALEPAGIGAPEVDSGLLGPDAPPGGLTVTVAVGASLFDARFGLGSRKPSKLTAMEPFPNDDLHEELCGGDLLLQICAHDRDTVIRALRDFMRHTRGWMQLAWRLDGFLSPSRPDGAPRNLLGFKDGTAQPPLASENSLIWVDAGEPAWARGGTYLVVRQIRMFVEFWDRVSLLEQNTMIGRDRVSGAPLSGTHEGDSPSYDNDPGGDVIQLDAHIRQANPRTTDTANQQILRRGYNFDAGFDASGNLNLGLIFVCFNQDLERQFKTIQRRLLDEPLVDYISPVGGGYFFAVPGVIASSDYLGSGLFAPQ